MTLCSLIIFSSIYYLSSANKPIFAANTVEEESENEDNSEAFEIIEQLIVGIQNLRAPISEEELVTFYDNYDYWTLKYLNALICFI